MALDKNKKKSINNLLKDINTKFGANSVSILTDIEEELRVKYFKTPSNEVNAMLGGGIGKGKIVELYGQASSGKTSLALEIIAKAQKEDENFIAAWLETEGSLDVDYLKYFNIDTDRLLIIRQTDELSAEKCMDILRSVIGSGDFNIVVLNSVAGLLPSKEVVDDMDKQNIALTARLLSKFFRITTGMLAKNNTSLILINQTRQNLGAYIVTAISCGGMAIPFYATQRVEMKREKVASGDPISEDDGVKIRCKVVKNRLAKGNPFKLCNYYALYGKGIDGVSELGTVLTREGILRKAGAWIRYEDENGNLLQVKSNEGLIDAKWQGNSKFIDFLRDNPSTREMFEKILDEKLTTGNVGVSLSKDEIQELEQMNLAIEKEVDVEDEAAATK